jgi:chromosome segregation ATPase
LLCLAVLVLPQVSQLGELQSPVHQLDPHLQLQLEAEREALQRRMAEAEAQTVAAMQAQRAAEARVAELQGEVAHLHSSYQAQAASRGAPQLEQQLRELQELLYQKQQQMERLSGEKQAQQLMLERQVGRVDKACTLCCVLLTAYRFWPLRPQYTAGCS